ALANPYFGWEVVRKLEGAIELGLLQNRVSLSVSYFRNRTSNQLVGYTLPIVAGYSSVQANLPAIIQNWGEELMLNTVNIKSNNFNWSSSLSLTLPYNKLIAFPNLDATPYGSTLTVGQPLSASKLYHYTGVDPQTGIYMFETKNTSGIPSYPQDYY